MTKADRSGLPTEEQLLDAAVSLFAQKWYGTVSVAEICRSAGLSNGVFYRYFENKEVLFKRILERVLELLKATVEGASGAGPKERLEDLEERVLRFSAEHPDLVSVFREGQYRYFDYERRLVALYLRALGQALGRGVELAEYLFALGGLRFCATQRVYNGAAIDPASILAIVENGLFRGMDFDPELVFGGTATPLPLPLDQDARTRLLRAGKRLFGEKGYYETNIHDVTGAAGLSVGAFYTYFASKEVFYAEIIETVGRQVRGFIARNLAPAAAAAGAAPAAAARPLNRLERELRGLWLWLVYLSIDKDCYAIVREAEFVLPDAVRDYYGRFVAGYRKNPEGNAAPGSGIDDGTAIEFLLGVAHYAGIEVAFDESPVNARAVVETIGRYLQRGFSEYLS